MTSNSRYIDTLLKTSFITCNDIMNIMNIDNNQFLNYYPTITTRKQKILCEIYLNPKLLYDCKNVSQKLIDKLINFVIYKYTSNVEEVRYRLELGQLSQEEYDNIVKTFEEFYFPYDNYMAKNIKRIMESKQLVLQKKQ